MIWDILFNIGYWVVKGYLSTPSSTKDEKVLDLVKNTLFYLAQKENNNFTYNDFLKIKNVEFKGDKK